MTTKDLRIALLFQCFYNYYVYHCLLLEDFNKSNASFFYVIKHCKSLSLISQSLMTTHFKPWPSLPRIMVDNDRTSDLHFGRFISRFRTGESTTHPCKYCLLPKWVKPALKITPLSLHMKEQKHHFQIGVNEHGLLAKTACKRCCLIIRLNH